jgi:2-amino-4-hydroxy-6-hydroxymethyldihydropteridine diphosphokinase
LGDRIAALRQGLRALQQGGVRVLAVSPLVEASAIGLENQPSFLNLVAACSWPGGPEALMTLISEVEEEAGRIRPFPNAPRTLDIDLLFFGEKILRVPGIQVPHPRWKGRRFVVQPLQALAPDLVDPETGLTVEEIGGIWLQEPNEVEELGSGEALLEGAPESRVEIELG